MPGKETITPYPQGIPKDRDLLDQVATQVSSDGPDTLDSIVPKVTPLRKEG